MMAATVFVIPRDIWGTAEDKGGLLHIHRSLKEARERIANGINSTKERRRLSEIILHLMSKGNELSLNSSIQRHQFPKSHIPTLHKLESTIFSILNETETTGPELISLSSARKIIEIPKVNLDVGNSSVSENYIKYVFKAQSIGAGIIRTIHVSGAQS